MIYNNGVIKTIFINIPYTNSEYINDIFGLDTDYNDIGFYYKNLGDEIFNYFNFSIVRNPWERMVMEYLDNNDNNINFDDYIKYPIINSYNKWHRYKNKYMLHYVMMYEDLQNDLSYVCGRLGIHNVKLNIKKDNINYRKFYDNKTKDLIFNLFKNEIVTYKYEF